MSAAVRHVRCGAIPRARGVLAEERGQLDEATRFYGQSLAFAREHGDRFLEATALLNLASDAPFRRTLWRGSGLRRGPPTTPRTRSVLADLAQTALGNLGFAYYRLGDSERALDLYLEAEKRAHRIRRCERSGLMGDEHRLRTDGRGQFRPCRNNPINGRWIWRERRKANRKRSMACVRWPKCRCRRESWSRRTNARTKRLRSREQEREPAGRTVSAAGERTGDSRQGDAARAETIFLDVQKDPKASAALVWGAQHALGAAA